jgi:NAD(P)-dependent dehydrogenase (short-subunit alcohol dehydrogenase family)
MNLNGKVAIITGAAAGLGQATVLEAAKSGAKIVAVDIDTDGLAETVRMAGTQAEIEPVTADLANESDIERVVAATESRFGRLDILINCAAVLPRAGTRVDRFPTDEWQRGLDINLSGSFYCVKHATPLLEKSGGGVIILVASGAGILGGSSSVPYAASKGGVHGIALCVKEQINPLGIRIHVALPPNMNTRMRVGAVGEMAALRGESREEAEREEYAINESPERSGKFLIGLATEEGGKRFSDQVLVTVGHWDSGD